MGSSRAYLIALALTDWRQIYELSSVADVQSACECHFR